MRKDHEWNPILRNLVVEAMSFGGGALLIGIAWLIRWLLSRLVQASFFHPVVWIIIFTVAAIFFGLVDILWKGRKNKRKETETEEEEG